VVNRHDIRAFHPVVKDGHLVMVLLLDTGRTVSSDYVMSRRKFK